MPPVVSWKVSWLLLVSIWLEVNGDCPARHPCTCQNDIIDCSGHGFTMIPYMLYQRKENFHTLAYDYNILTEIQPSAFANLNISRLLLNHNNISVIAEAAFNGIEGILKELNLANNNLKTVPVSMGYIRSLQILDLSYNPLDGTRQGLRPREMLNDFTDLVMRELGDSLVSLTFGDTTLSHWPMSLHYAIQLRRLYLTGSLISYMRTGWFRGFEQTLATLSISHCWLVQIPIDIGILSQLTELVIEHNQYEHGDSFLIESPFLGIADTLTTLTLRYDNLTMFPEVIKHLTKMQNLSLEGNNLVFISEEAIQFLKETRLRYLSLKKCGLSRIPGAISELKALLELDLSGNHVKTIESRDIVRMPELLTLSLSNNPLKYISRMAFRGLKSVTFLDISDSEITVLPDAIQNLWNVHTVDLTGSKTDCTCDLYWVKRWMNILRKNVTFLGNCETIQQSVDRYINYRIPTCPQFVLLG